MRKMVSSFSLQTARKSKSDSAVGGDDAERSDEDMFEDPHMEREMMRLMKDAENIDENDPRQLGALMRRMSDITGEPVEPEMEEAMRRVEAGEDPEKIEEELGDVLGDGEAGAGMPGAPSYDDGLYPM